MKKTSKLLSLLMALSMTITACGGSSTPAEESTEPASGDAQSTAENTETPAGDENIQVATDKDTLVVSATDLNGDFINGFTNSSYDVWVRRLMGNYGGDLGYATYYNDEVGEWLPNKTVLAEDPVRTENADGTVTHQFKLKDNLLWNDGTPITAKDYVFGNLFANSPAWAATGASNATTGMELLGFEPYYKGETQTYAGLHLLDDHTFTVTLAKEYVPYFYESAIASMSPTPMHRYAPNLDVVEMSEGATLQVKAGYQVTDADKNTIMDNQKKAIESAKKEFDETKSAALEAAGKTEDEYAKVEAALDALGDEERDAALQAGKVGDMELEGLTDIYDAHLTVKKEEDKLASYEADAASMDPKDLLLTAAALEVSQVYRFKPDVTCGPYQFVSFENGMAKVTLNDKFVGNKDGKKPTVPNVIVQAINQKLDVDFVLQGSIDIAPGVIEGEKIGKAIKAEEEGKLQLNSYPRNGYGVMPILTAQGSTQYKGVRQAIAYCMNRDEFVQNIAGGYGTVVQAAYGLDMWEYKELADEIEDPNNTKLRHYSLNVDEGNKALDTDSPYKFEADGKTPWDPAKATEAYEKDKENFSYWRYDDQGNQLVVYHEGTTDNPVTDLIVSLIPDAAKRMGMQYLYNKTDFATMLTHYYSPNKNDPQAPTVFNMGTSFAQPNDPFYSYHSKGNDNRNQVNDPALDATLETMRRAKPEDRETWLNGFRDFVYWYNDYMPAIPLYGNTYYDVYSNRVEGLETSSLWNWDQDICDITLKAE